MASIHDLSSLFTYLYDLYCFICIHLPILVLFVSVIIYVYIYIFKSYLCLCMFMFVFTYVYRLKKEHIFFFFFKRVETTSCKIGHGLSQISVWAFSEINIAFMRFDKV